MRRRLTGFFLSGVILPRTSSIMRTGTSVMPSRAAKPMAKVLVKASGLKSLPSWAVSEKTGTKLTVMTRSEKKRGLPTLRAAAMMTSTRSAFPGSRPRSSRKCSSCLCAFSTMMIAASTMAPMAIAMPPSDMMLEVSPSACMGMNESRIAIGQRDDRHQRRAHVPEEDEADQRDDDALLDQLLPQGGDGRVDQLAPVIGGDDLDPGGSEGAISFSFCLDAVDDREGVLAVAHHDDAADRLALAVELGDAAAQVGPRWTTPTFLT
jgi:hypothetical protein